MMRCGPWMLVAVLVGAGCAGQETEVPPPLSEGVAPLADNASRVPVGPLVLGTWLPAGLDRYRFSAEDQRILAALGLNQIEWLQRAEQGGETAEARAMAFCNAHGLQMPVYYEPRGFTPYDKLQNWARRPAVGEAFADSVALRVRALKAQWRESPAFQGYLVGHEDYAEAYGPALGEVVAAIGRVDTARPVLTVGRLDHYEDRDALAAALFRSRGAPNIFQHEHYVFHGNVPARGAGLQKKLDFLLDGYDQVAEWIVGYRGRWHAIVQVQSEVRGEKVYYRKPTAAEIAVQAGLALSRGASGIVYFLYSSGVEKYRNEAGEWVQTRYYEGLVDTAGAPTASYAAVQQLNQKLRALSPVLAGLHFYGSTGMAGALVASGDADLEFGYFGDRARPTHALVVNRRTGSGRAVGLEVRARVVRDALTGAVLAEGDTNARHALQIDLEPGGFRLLHCE